MSKSRQAADRAFAATRKNLVVNGSMQISQRGSSGTVTTGAGTYMTDRWFARATTSTGGSQTWTHTTSTIYGESGLTLTTSGLTSSTYITNRVEGLVPNGTILTVSCEFEPSVDCQLVIGLATLENGNQVDQGILQDGIVYAGGQKHRIVFTAPPIVDLTGTTSINDFINCQFSIVNPAGAGATLDGDYTFRKVQIEEGSEATAFEYRHIGEELTLCQRYAENIGAISGSRVIAVGHVLPGGTRASFNFPYNTQKRTAALTPDSVTSADYRVTTGITASPQSDITNLAVVNSNYRDSKFICDLVTPLPEGSFLELVSYVGSFIVMSAEL